MTQPETPDESVEQKKSSQPSGIIDALKKPFIAFILLFAVWAVFGHLVPAFIFPAAKPIQTEQPLQPISPPPPPHAQGANGDPLGKLNARIDQLEAQLQAYEELLTAMPQSAPMSDEMIAVDDARIVALEKKLEILQQQINQNIAQSSERIAAFAALSKMREAAMNGEKFFPHYQRFMELNAANSNIQNMMLQLSTYTEGGIPTITELQTSFEALVPKALSPHKPSSIMGNLQSLVTIRKVGEQQGDSDEAILARAELLLKKGRLELTKEQMLKLSEHATTTFADWLGSVSTRLKIQRTFDELQLMLSEEPTAPAGQAPDRV